jgi:hypothetical protein
MDAITIVLIFFGAYGVFMTAAYFLARVFFPLEDQSAKDLMRERRQLAPRRRLNTKQLQQLHTSVR